MVIALGSSPGLCCLKQQGVFLKLVIGLDGVTTYQSLNAVVVLYSDVFCNSDLLDNNNSMNYFNSVALSCCLEMLVLYPLFFQFIFVWEVICSSQSILLL
jgi:hypothetical protein